jgi:hypothetical protein
MARSPSCTWVRTTASSRASSRASGTDARSRCVATSRSTSTGGSGCRTASPCSS